MANIKGVALAGIIAGLRSMRSEAEPMLGPEVLRYLDDGVIANGWYPETDYRELVLTLGTLISNDVSGDVWEYLGEEGAKAQFAAVYSMAVRDGNPIGTLKRAATTWSLYHDTGTVEVAIDKAQRGATVRLAGYPLAETRLCSTTTGYLRQLLVQAGAREVDVRLKACPRCGDGPVVWEVRWSH